MERSKSRMAWLLAATALLVTTPLLACTPEDAGTAAVAQVATAPQSRSTTTPAVENQVPINPPGALQAQEEPEPPTVPGPPQEASQGEAPPQEVAPVPPPIPSQPSGSSATSSTQRNLEPQVSPDQVTQAAQGNTAFAFDLYQSLRGQQDGNLFFSPYSISVALTMTFAGARGETESQMGSTLHLALPPEQIHAAANALDLELASRAQGALDEAAGQHFQLNVANALWGQTGYTFLPEFLDTLAANYGAGLQLVDFAGATEAARLAINEWVAQRTEDRIQDLLQPGILTAVTRLVLTNAVYFNASWAHPFQPEATDDAPFTLLDGTEVSVPTMVQTTRFGYGLGMGYEVVVLPYVGEQVSMAIVLPAPGQFEEIEARLTAENGPGLIETVAPNRLRLYMPRFRTEAEFNLTQTLVQMGMTDAMSIERADFSGMTGGRDLYISEVVHKAFVSVDEAGTEAAAATAVVMSLRSAIMDQPIEVRVDRPFIFVIRDDETGTILFMGRVLDPRS